MKLLPIDSGEIFQDKGAYYEQKTNGFNDS